jgi:hypothetical protein
MFVLFILVLFGYALFAFVLAFIAIKISDRIGSRQNVLRSFVSRLYRSRSKH